MNTTLKIKNGTTVTVRAWSFGQGAASLSNYLSLLEALRQMREDPDPQEAQALADLVLTQAGLDAAEVLAADLPAILEVIHELNDVEELLGKPIALLVRNLAALQKAQRPEEPESGPNAPGTPPTSQNS